METNKPYKEKTLFGKIYKFFYEEWVYESHIMQLEEFDFSKPFYTVNEKAWLSRFWTVKGYNGKSIIKDKWVARLPSWFHDFYSRIGMGGIENDTLFLYSELKCKTNKNWALTQYYFVRGGTQILIVRDWITGRRKKKDPILKNIYKLCLQKLDEEFGVKPLF